MESVCNRKGLSQNSLGGHSPSDERLGPSARRRREPGEEEWGRGARVGEEAFFVAMLAGNFEDFSRLVDDYLDLRLFCLTTVMTGRLGRARGVYGQGTVEGVQRVPGSHPPGGLSRWPGPSKSQPNSKQTWVR